MGNGTNLKRRYLAAAFTLLLLVLFALILAANADILLSSERGAATLNPVSLLLRVFMSRRCLFLWLLLDGLAILSIYWALFGRSYLDYHSRMFEVVPGFEIPVPEGQGQHGTAWWMAEEDYGRAFSAAYTGDGIELSEQLENRYAAERGRVDDVG